MFKPKTPGPEVTYAAIIYNPCQIERQIYRHIYRQTDRQTFTHTHTHTHRPDSLVCLSGENSANESKDSIEPSDILKETK